MHVLFQFVQVVDISHLAAKFYAARPISFSESKDEKLEVRLHSVVATAAGAAEQRSTKHTHLMTGLKSCQTMRMKLVGWTRNKAFRFFLYFLSKAL